MRWLPAMSNVRRVIRAAAFPCAALPAVVLLCALSTAACSDEPDRPAAPKHGPYGEGVAAANLAGRTMAELVSRQHTERTSAPWVGARARSWEPEPLRWLGVRTSRRILALADDREFRTDKQASLAFRISRMLRGAWR